MKQPIALLIALSAFLFAFSAQARQSKVYTIEEANAAGITLDKLDSSYKPALGEGIECVFSESPDAFTGAYQQFVRDLGGHLSKNGFIWERPTYCYSRIYFSEDGKVDYFIFLFKEGELSEDRLSKFKEHAEAFLAMNGIGMSGPVKFSQCSPVKFMSR